jgi:hypothetical protein
MGSVMTPQGRRSARIAAKNEAKEVLETELGVSLFDVSAKTAVAKNAIDETLDVAGFVEEGRGGSRRRKLRGGVGEKVGAVIQSITKDIIAKFNRAVDKAETDATTALTVIQTAGNELVDASGKLGRASVMATAAYVAVKALDASGKYVPSATWGQLGAGFAAFAKTVLVDLPITAVRSSAANPVVAVALATAFTKLRAQYNKVSVAALVKQDLMTLLSKAANWTTAQIQGFQDANLVTKKQMLIANLSEIKKNLKPGGKGYESLSRDSILATQNEANLLLEVMKAMETPPPEPAASSSSSSAAPPEESAVVAPPPAPSAEPRPTPLLRIPSDREEAAEMARENRFAAMEEERRREKIGLDRKKPPKDGGRRKTRRGKKVKRRVTHKVKFAY